MALPFLEGRAARVTAHAALSLRLLTVLRVFLFGGLVSLLISTEHQYRASLMQTCRQFSVGAAACSLAYCVTSQLSVLWDLNPRKFDYGAV